MLSVKPEMFSVPLPALRIPLLPELEKLSVAPEAMVSVPDTWTSLNVEFPLTVEVPPTFVLWSDAPFAYMAPEMVPKPETVSAIVRTPVPVADSAPLMVDEPKLPLEMVRELPLTTVAENPEAMSIELIVSAPPLT